MAHETGACGLLSMFSRHPRQGFRPRLHPRHDRRFSPQVQDVTRPLSISSLGMDGIAGHPALLLLRNTLIREQCRDSRLRLFVDSLRAEACLESHHTSGKQGATSALAASMLTPPFWRAASTSRDDPLTPFSRSGQNTCFGMPMWAAILFPYARPEPGPSRLQK